MQHLTLFPSPLPSAPPSSYAWSEHPLSELSTTTAFNTGINQRDRFLGWKRCVICGRLGDTILEHCHILPRREEATWRDLKDRRWLPRLAKDTPEHELRNGLLLCRNHHGLFDGHQFFIRYFPTVKKFVMIDYSEQDSIDIRPYHGKAIALDITDRNAPFPSLFIIHEMRVRGYHPFHDTTPLVPHENDIEWQDWVETSGVWDHTRGEFRRHEPHHDGGGASGPPKMPPMPTHEGGGPSAVHTQPLELSEKVIADVLAAMRAMPSWKECEMEGIRWTGTAEENREKYLSVSRA